MPGNSRTSKAVFKRTFYDALLVALIIGMSCGILARLSMFMGWCTGRRAISASSLLIGNRSSRSTSAAPAPKRQSLRSTDERFRRLVLASRSDLLSLTSDRLQQTIFFAVTVLFRLLFNQRCRRDSTPQQACCRFQLTVHPAPSLIADDLKMNRAFTGISESHLA